MSPGMTDIEKKSLVSISAMSRGFGFGISLEIKRLGLVSRPEFWSQLRSEDQNFGLGQSQGQIIRSSIRRGLNSLVLVSISLSTSWSRSQRSDLVEYH